METTKSYYKLPQEYPYLVQINHDNLQKNLIQPFQSSYLINNHKLISIRYLLILHIEKTKA